MHKGFVFGDESPDLHEFLPQIVLHRVLAIASLALHVSADGGDLLGEEVTEAVHGGAVVGGPGVRRRDYLALPFSWGVLGSTAPPRAGPRRAGGATNSSAGEMRRNGLRRDYYSRWIGEE